MVDEDPRVDVRTVADRGRLGMGIADPRVHKGWGKGNLHDKDKHAYEKYDYEYGHAGDHKKHDRDGKLGSHHKSGWDDLDKHWWGKLQKHRDYDGHDFVKWGKGHGNYDPDCVHLYRLPNPRRCSCWGRP
jgi:hypothetical protein